MRARLAQVLANLIGNAVKYTPGRRAGQVVVGAAGSGADGGPVRIRVTDNGIGIPARDLPHVFDKFYRVKNASTAGIAGTGLGLAITRSIVETHRGRIGVESAEGSGSTFWVELPARRRPAPTAPRDAELAPEDADHGQAQGHHGAPLRGGRDLEVPAVPAQQPVGDVQTQALVLAGLGGEEGLERAALVVRRDAQRRRLRSRRARAARRSRS